MADSTSTEKLWVVAGENGPVHQPDVARADRRNALIANEPVEVEDTRFIRLRLIIGDLVRVPAPSASKGKKE